MHKIESSLLKCKKTIGLKRAIVFSLFLLVVCKGYSTELPQLSSNSLISLVTCSPTSSYEGTFGHSAIRIQDDSLKIDVAFNYGMYNKAQSFFFLKVLLGTLESSLEGEAFYKFAQRYHEEGRGMREYYLDLTLAERQRIWESLNQVLMSNNRFYNFNVTLSNCTTHTRDVLFKQLNLDTSLYKGLFSGYTFREAELRSPMQNCWLHLLFNLIVGANADANSSVYQAAFSPDGLLTLLKAVNENERSIVVAEHELFPVIKMKEAPEKIIPIVFFSILLFISLLLSYIQSKHRKVFVGFDRVLFLLSGATGLFFLGIMIFSEIPELRVNYNILWALPTNIVLAFLINAKSYNNKWTCVLVRFTVVSTTCFLLLSFRLQHIPVEAYLFAVTLLVRLYFYILKDFKNKR